MSQSRGFQLLKLMVDVEKHSKAADALQPLHMAIGALDLPSAIEATAEIEAAYATLPPDAQDPVAFESVLLMKEILTTYNAAHLHCQTILLDHLANRKETTK